MQVGPAAAAQEQAISRDHDPVPEEGQVPWRVAGCSDGFESQFAHVQGSGHVGGRIEGTGVGSSPTSLFFGTVDDHLESFTAQLNGLFHAFGVVPMAVGEPSAN